MLTTQAKELLQRKLDELESGEWTPHDYPFWAWELTAHAEALVAAAAEDDEVADLFVTLQDAVAEVWPSVTEGTGELEPDSMSAMLADAVGARSTHFWLKGP